MVARNTFFSTFLLLFRLICGLIYNFDWFWQIEGDVRQPVVTRHPPVRLYRFRRVVHGLQLSRRPVQDSAGSSGNSMQSQIIFFCFFLKY